MLTVGVLNSHAANLGHETSAPSRISYGYTRTRDCLHCPAVPATVESVQVVAGGGGKGHAANRVFMVERLIGLKVLYLLYNTMLARRIVLPPSAFHILNLS